MTEVLCEVTGCGRPVADQAYVCSSCASQLTSDLFELTRTERAGLLYELTVTLTKQDRISAGDSGQRQRHTPPLPYSVVASEAGSALHNALQGWVRVIAAEQGAALPVDDVAELARWLRARVNWLRHHREGAEAVHELTVSINSIRRVIDRPPVFWFAGPCDEEFNGERCTAELYARPGAVETTCQNCGARHDVAARRRWLLEQVENQLAHATALGALVRHLGVQVGDSTVRNYARKGRLVAHARDVRGRPLYRIGDVLELVLGPR